MLADPARCTVHGTVLTTSGACLLCVRRNGGGEEDRASPAGRGALVWTLALVVGGLVTTAVVFRVYLSIADRHTARAASAEPTPTATVVAARGPEPAPTDPNDRESLIAAAERSVSIEFYGASWCPACREAKSWLDSRGIAYTYFDVDQAANKRPMRALNPRGSIPTIKIEDQVLVGFNPRAMQSSIRRAAEARVAEQR